MIINYIKNHIIWLSLIFLIFPITIYGALVDELNNQIQQTEAKRLGLEKKAQEYEQIINQKQGEIRSLNNQVIIFNARINKLQVEININQDKTSQTELEILQLEYGIDGTNNDIIRQKENLAEIIRTIAQSDQVSQLEIILQSEDFSDFFNQIAYLDNLQNGIRGKVDQLRELKQSLNQDKESKEEKKARLVILEKQLVGQKWSLAGQRNTKESLLRYTRGEEDQYQKMLANIEVQKKSILGDINRLRQEHAAELARLKETQEKPPSRYWASLSWYYNQTDPRWAKTTIGISNSIMEEYGCAIADVAMIFQYNKINMTPGQLAKESIYAWDLIYWPKRWGSIGCVNCPPPHTTPFDWFKLDREIGAGYPVIVFIRANGKGAGHYVVVHNKTDDGRYVVHDPLFGANIYLDSTRAYISALYKTTTSLDQMIIYH